MNTVNPERLKNVVRLLKQKQGEIDSYMEAYVFRPYGINIKSCILSQSMVDAKKLMDFSFHTRQGGQQKSAIEKYEKEEKEAFKILKFTLGILVKKDTAPRKRYEIALALINSLDNVGQKITTMFLKFLIYYSDYFEGKAELEQELFIPFDSHVLKLLFVRVNGEKMSRLNLYDESVNQAALKYEVYKGEGISLKENKLVRLQRNIREDFDNLGIEEPPITLDYLWYVGSMYCSKRFGDIGCKICFLMSECEKGYET